MDPHACFRQAPPPLISIVLNGLQKHQAFALQSWLFNLPRADPDSGLALCTRDALALRTSSDAR